MISKEAAVVDIYGGKNPLEMPLYTYADASRYLAIPSSTVTYWVKGGPTTGKEGKRAFYKPVLPAHPESGLSFFNLVELHTLKALRRVHEVSLKNIRSALVYAEQTLGIDRLLLSEALSTHGGEVFIQYLEETINLSRGGQMAIQGILERYLRRVERDDKLIPIKLYPDFEGIGEKRPVVINPRVSFGKPTVAGTGIHTAVIAHRIDAGESVEDLVQDYGISAHLIEEVVRYEKAA